MQLGRTTLKGRPSEECHGQSSVLCRLPYIVPFFRKVLFVGCIAQMGVANNQNSKKILRTGVILQIFRLF